MKRKIVFLIFLFLLVHFSIVIPFTHETESQGCLSCKDFSLFQGKPVDEWLLVQGSLPAGRHGAPRNPVIKEAPDIKPWSFTSWIAESYVSFYLRKVRVPNDTHNSKFEIFPPSGNENLDYGLKQRGRPEYILVSGNGDTSVLEQLGIKAMNIILPAAMAGFFGSGKGAEVAEDKYKPVFKNIKPKIDKWAVRAAQNQMVEFAKKTGYVILLEGEEGPGRDKAAGAIPGTIICSKGMILPSRYEEVLDQIERKKARDISVPSDIESLMKILRSEGIDTTQIKGVVAAKLDTVENTTNTTKGKAGGWSFASMSVYDFSKEGPTPEEVLETEFHYTPDYYIGGWTFSAPKPVDISPYEPPSSAIPKIAGAYGESTEEYLNKTKFVVLERSRHKAMIEDLRNMGANIETIKDGDMPARILSIINPNHNRRVVVLGASGANEASAAIKAATVFKQGQFSLIHTTKNSSLLEEDVVTWQQMGYNFTEDELSDFKELNIPEEHYTTGINSDSLTTSPHALNMVALVSLTGARKEIFGDLASELGSIEIIPHQEGKGADINFTMLLTVGGRGNEGQSYIIKIPYETSNLEKTKTMLTHMGRQFDVYESPPR